MKKGLLTYFALIIFGFFSEARITDNQVIYKKEPGLLKIEPKKGFHLNAEAPTQATFDGLEAIYKPSEKTEKRFTFKLVEKAKKAKLSYYVCDDKKTACEAHQDELDLATLSSTSAFSASSAPLAAAAGFIDSNLSSQMEDQLLISKNGKPTLLIFSAPWCPACIRMQTETYPIPKVSVQLKKVNFLKVNSDLPENYDLSEKFQVKAIPTLILLNTDGEEVYRWLDFQEPTSFAKSLEQETKKIGASKNTTLQLATLGDPKAISALGRLYYNALNCAEAVRWLSLSKNPEDKKFKLAAEVSCMQEQVEKDENAVPEYLQALEKAMVLSPSKIDQQRWTVDWIEKKKESKELSEEVKAKAKALLAELEKQGKNQKRLATEFKESTFGESAGFESAEVNLMRSRLFAALGLSAEKEKSDLKIIRLINANKYSTKRPGQMLIAIYYLREAGEKDKVSKMYNDLVGANPTSYVYYEKHGRYLLKEKKYEMALHQVENALRYPEGNQPQLYLLKARILKEMNQKEKMLETLTAAEQFKDIKHPKYKKTVAQLTKLKEESSKK